MRRAVLLVAMVALGVALVAGVAVAANITGTGAANTITGTDSADKISGGGGGDFIKGLAGPDKLWADFGDDDLLGNTGDDLLVTLDLSGGDTALGGENEGDNDICVVDAADDFSGCEKVVQYPPPVKE